MELSNQIEKLAAKFKKYPEEYYQNIEATKYSFVLPFLDMLGYDLFDPNEVEPDFAAKGSSDDSGVKVDYAVRVDEKVEMLVQCSRLSEELSSRSLQELRTCFVNSGARMGIQTNGVVYHFYSDLEQTGQMDDTPLMILDVSKIANDRMKERVMPKLEKLSRQHFDVDWIKSQSYSGKLVTKIADYLKGQLNNPDQAFIDLLKNELSLSAGIDIDDQTWAKSIRKVQMGAVPEPGEDKTEQDFQEDAYPEDRNLTNASDENTGGFNGHDRNGTDGSSIEEDFELTPTEDDERSELEEELKASDLHRPDSESDHNTGQALQTSINGNGEQNSAGQSATSTQQSVQHNFRDEGNYRPGSPELRKKREEGLDLLKSIIEEVISDHRVGEQHYKGYSDLVVNGLENNPIARFHYAEETKYLGLFDANNMEYKIPIDSLEDVHQFADQIKLLARKYDEKA